jgi:serine protease Do
LIVSDGQPDPLNEQAKPPRRWLTQAVAVVVVITIGIVSGAKLWQPVRKVEQKVTAPIREAVRRGSPIENLPDLVDSVCPAVVALHYDGAPDPAPQAIVLSQDGFAITTIAIDPDTAVGALLNDGSQLAARVVRRDAVAGLTLLKLDGKDLATLALGDMDLPRLGAWGFTLASPVGHGCAVESGLVASDFVTEAATADYYLRVHAGPTPPAPGTPFLTADGRLAGLAQPVVAHGGPSDHFLPIDVVTTAVSALLRGQPAPESAFGMSVEDLSPALADRLGADRGRGAVIVTIVHGGPAETSGLQVGDVILSAGQSPISSSSEFGRRLFPGQPIDLVISRGLDQTTRTITLKPAAAPTG